MLAYTIDHVFMFVTGCLAGATASIPRCCELGLSFPAGSLCLASLGPQGSMAVHNFYFKCCYLTHCYIPTQNKAKIARLQCIVLKTLEFVLLNF